MPTTNETNLDIIHRRKPHALLVAAGLVVIALLVTMGCLLAELGGGTENTPEVNYELTQSAVLRRDSPTPEPPSITDGPTVTPILFTDTPVPGMARLAFIEGPGQVVVDGNIYKLSTLDQEGNPSFPPGFIVEADFDTGVMFDIVTYGGGFAQLFLYRRTIGTVDFTRDGVTSALNEGLMYVKQMEGDACVTLPDEGKGLQEVTACVEMGQMVVAFNPQSDTPDLAWLFCLDGECRWEDEDGNGYTFAAGASGKKMSFDRSNGKFGSIENIKPADRQNLESGCRLCLSGLSATPTITPIHTATPVVTGEVLYSVSGKVRNRTGDPLVGAAVSIIELPNIETNTNASGFYELTKLRPGKYTLQALQNGYYSATLAIEITNASLLNKDIILDKKPQNVYTLLVNVKEGGVGLDGVAVRADGTVSDGCTTNSNGQCNITLPNGTYLVSGNKSGYSIDSQTARIADANATVTLFASRNDYTLTVTVNGPSGGLGGVDVRASPGIESCTTAANGKCTMKLADGNYIISGNKPGYTISDASVKIAGRENSVTLNATLDTYTLTVTVNGPAGTLGGVSVSASPGGENCTTASNGICSLSLANGNYTISGSKTGYSIGDEQVTISGANKAVTLNATENTYTLAVTVNGPGGALSGVSVTADPGGENCTTAANGKCNLNLSNGNYTIFGDKAGYIISPASATINNANSSVTLNAELETYTLTVTVNGPGGALSGVDIFESPGGDSCTTQANGQCTMSLPNGQHTISGIKDGYDIPPQNVTINGAPNSVTLNATEITYSVAGTVVTNTGNPLGGANVAAGPTGGGSGYETSSATDGSFSFDLPAGNYIFSASITGYTCSPTGAINVSGPMNIGEIQCTAVASRVTVASGAVGWSLAASPWLLAIFIRMRFA